MLATEVTENTEVFSFAGAASAVNSSRPDGLFTAKTAPTFTVVQINNNKLSICPCGKQLSYQASKSGEEPIKK